MEQKGLVRSEVLGFVENALKSVESMLQYSQTLLDSGLCPNHFYEKDEKGKPIVSKGKPAAVLMVLQHGLEVGFSPMQSLQQIVPVNGLVSVKGDGAKSLIFGSGVLEPGSWIEKEFGDIEKEDYTFSITAKRRDNGLVITRSFSVDAAKRAGLWIDKAKVNGTDGWKWKLSPWYKYPDRMVRYRALGFIARDLFADVIAGMYTTEEAQDMPLDQSVVIESKLGASITIPDKDFAKERSNAITQKATEKIDKMMAKNPIIPKNEPNPNFDQEAEIVVDYSEEAIASGDEVIEVDFEYTLEYLTKISTEELMGIVNTSPLMKKALTNLPGKNTSKKLRDIIIAYQNNTLEGMFPTEVKPKEAIPTDPDSVGITPGQNKFGISVSELPAEGQRSFDETKNLYDEMSGVAGIDNARFVSLVESNLPELQKYPDKEQFCFKATRTEINSLLNSI